MRFEPPGNQTLLLSKLSIPQPRETTVERPRLRALLDEGLANKATFLAAPAGYGKTTLAADWIRRLDARVGWLSLDDKDNDLVRFWSYVAQVLEQAIDGLSDAFRSAAATLAPGLYEPFLVALLNELGAVREPVVLALDDWHVIADEEIAESVSYLMEYLPEGTHLLFASRTGTRFPKARWLSRGWAREIRAADLRFDLGEAMELFRRFGERETHRDQIEDFLSRTEGWITGLKLILLSMRGGTQATATARKLAHAGGERIERFLMEEVVESLDERDRQFLLDVSVLRRMNGSLCEAVAGTGGAARLAALARIDLFLVPLDESKTWYRFHHLFGEFLQDMLRRRDPGRTDGLYRAAAEWCEAQGLLEEAIDYRIAGAQYDQAIRLLEEMRSLMIRREFSTLRVWLSAIPEEMLLRHPYLYFSYILSLLWTLELERAERHLQRAERYYESAASGWTQEERDRYLGYLYFARNFKATQYEMDMIKGLEYIRLSLRHSPGGTDLIFASPEMPLCPSIYRSYNGKRGKHLPRGLSDDFFHSMIGFMRQMGLHDSVLVCYGELLYERGELEAAERYLKEGLSGQSQAHYQPEKVYVPASLFLSRIARARRDPAQAEQWLAEALARAESEGAAAAPILLEAERAALRLEQDDASAARTWRERYRLTADDPVSVYQLFVYLFLVRTLMETGAGDEAWRLSERLLHLAVKGHRPMDALELQVLQAVMLDRAGKPEQALLKLEEALKHALPDDYIRVFVDKGKPVAELLAAYVQQRQKGNIRDKHAPPLAYVRKILAGFGEAPETGRTAAAALETLLTPRELTIFRQMEEGMDNPAIAEALGIGMGTLKAHINRIYSKLQATSRVEAIKRGKALQGQAGK
ncbi:LuxR C-terminal-related transcriptional regulator [Cohnella sp. REN36]|uniref:LuxR C-terminal-related transcriptional regulator n=1 Tax=Cohnella sp. REN36 TaxID=2887347 RepID=UPI001D140892|nr:LuxR C-terminal-related transcriptional regulator [Cohnella sp. REN36]MCC3375065.1 LuxR C-terminal-related transcriptional regulator [Cohnella sp. REN36]